ncbi:MAG: hypothetical protein BJ554DRAFT_2845, partial [Olpidium bornovanus]
IRYPQDLNDGKPEPPSRLYPITLFTKSLICDPKVTVNARIVVIGGSDAGLSILEHLVYKPPSLHKSHSHLDRGCSDLRRGKVFRHRTVLHQRSGAPARLVELRAGRATAVHKHRPGAQGLPAQRRHQGRLRHPDPRPRPAVPPEGPLRRLQRQVLRKHLRGEPQRPQAHRRGGGRLRRGEASDGGGCAERVVVAGNHLGRRLGQERKTRNLSGFASAGHAHGRRLFLHRSAWPSRFPSPPHHPGLVEAGGDPARIAHVVPVAEKEDPSVITGNAAVDG